MAGGRPTDYDPSYPKLLLETMSRGDTLACFCSDVGIARETAYAWMKDHKEFSDAYKKAQENALKYWEKILSLCATGKPFIDTDGSEYKNYNVTAMIFLMKSRFKDYKETIALQSQEIEYSDPESIKA